MKNNSIFVSQTKMYAKICVLPLSKKDPGYDCDGRCFDYIIMMTISFCLDFTFYDYV